MERQITNTGNKIQSNLQSQSHTSHISHISHISHPKGKFYMNVIIIIKAAAIGVWFYGINRILNKYFPNPSLLQIALMFAVSMSILLYDDGLLSELHDLKPETIAAITNSSDGGSSNHENFHSYTKII